MRNYRVYGRFVAVASEGGVTFWTGNHPLAIGEGDLAANPDLKRRSWRCGRDIRASAEERWSRSIIATRSRWIRAHPLAVAGAGTRKMFYLARADRPVLCGCTRSGIRPPPSVLVSAPAAGALVGAWRLGARRSRRRGSVAAGGVGGARVPRVFSAGAIPDSRDRSRADRLRWRLVRACGGTARRSPPMIRFWSSLPTYNERRTSNCVDRGILQHDGFRLLVVDDGRRTAPGDRRRARPDASGPRRGHAPHRPTRARPLVHRRPAPRDSRPTPMSICQMDADLSHDPEYLPALVGRGCGPSIVVIGSRYLNGVSVVNWPLHRILLSAFANRYIRLGHRSHPHDCTSGYRCWRREALADCRSTTHGIGRLRVPRRNALRGRAAAAAGSAKCRSSSSSGRQGQSKCRPTVLVESLLSRWRLIAHAGRLARRPGLLIACVTSS